jgi:hypothetical protein
MFDRTRHVARESCLVEHHVSSVRMPSTYLGGDVVIGLAETSEQRSTLFLKKM